MMQPKVINFILPVVGNFNLNIRENACVTADACNGNDG